MGSNIISKDGLFDCLTLLLVRRFGWEPNAVEFVLTSGNRSRDVRDSNIGDDFCLSEINWEESDPLGRFYQRQLTRAQRDELGEYYTPEWLATLLCQRAIAMLLQDRKNCRTENSPITFLDPSCGSGVFLKAMSRQLRTRGISWRTILQGMWGLDINPEAVYLARASFMLLWGEEAESGSEESRSLLTDLFQGKILLPIYCYDSLANRFVHSGEQETDGPRKHLDCQVELVLGNPPWLNWDHLSPERRMETRPLWERYGLFNLSGKEARLGGGKKELAALVLYRSADLFLRNGGLLTMVLPFSLFQTRKSGEGFRRMRLGTKGPNLALLELNDFGEYSPFPEVQTRTGTVLLRKGDNTVWPVPCDRWFPENDERDKPKAIQNKTLDQLPLPVRWWATPSNSSDCSDGTGPIVLMESQTRSVTNHVPSEYKAQLGCNTGGANGIFWLECLTLPEPDGTLPPVICVRNMPHGGKLPIPAMEFWVESDLIYPLLRWRDVAVNQAIPNAFILMVQNPETRQGIDPDVMKNRYPLCWRYLYQFEKELKSRAMYRKLQASAPFWSMYNVSRETYAPYKVVWRRMDSQLRAAAIGPHFSGKPIIPQETLALVSVESLEEANYLAAQLNSPETQRKVMSVSIPGSKGFGSPGILQHLGISKYRPLF